MRTIGLIVIAMTALGAGCTTTEGSLGEVTQAVTLDPPTVSATAVSTTRIEVSWNASADATKYYVFQSTGGSPFSYTTTVLDTSYSSAGLMPATEYSFKVQAADDFDSLSPDSNVATATTDDGGNGGPGLDAPQNVTAQRVLPSRVELDWSPVTDAVKYYVFQAEGAGSFAYVTTVQTNQYTAAGLNPDSDYSWFIQAANAADVVSPDSAIVSTASLPTPPMVTATPISNSRIEVEWTSVNGAVKYYVFQSEAGGPLVYVGTLLSPYSAANLAEATSYGFVVQAVDANDQVISTSDIVTATTAGTPVSGVSPPSVVNATAISTSRITVDWSSVSGAAKYYVFQQEGGGGLVYIGTATSTELTATGLASNTQYSFYIQAVDSADVASANSNAATATTQSDGPGVLAPAEILATTISDSRIELTWSAVEGAANYYVFQAVSGGSFVYVTTVSALETSFSATGLSASTEYSYVVQTVDAANNVSPSSATATATTNPADPT